MPTERPEDDEPTASKMTAEEAMAEIWSTFGPDCGPGNYKVIVEHVIKLVADLYRALNQEEA